MPALWEALGVRAGTIEFLNRSVYAFAFALSDAVREDFEHSEVCIF
jgi:hypothetical protein